MTHQVDRIWLNAKLIQLTSESQFAVIERGAIAQTDGKISLLCSMAELDRDVLNRAHEIVDVEGRCITPGLVDCHTHIIFGDNRALEYEKRLQGIPYEQISQEGGGIVSSVKATRNASEQDLYQSAKQRLLDLQKDGVTTVEVKSGYGLDLQTERKMLTVARRLGEDLGMTVRTTFLGAHALPEEFKDNRKAYINYLCKEVLPALHAEGLVDAVDAFCESIAFTTIEIEQLYQAAKKLGLDVKMHAEQLSNLGGSKLAANYSALSSDHLEYLDEAGVKALSKSGSVAVLLPGAFFMLAEKQKPPVELLRKYKVPMAVATDSNPGTSPVLSLRLMIVMACRMFGLTPLEAIRGATIHAAQALALENEIGTLEIGKQSDLVVWELQEPAELAYWLAGDKVFSVVKDGIEVYAKYA